MSLIKETLSRLRSNHKKALIAYITAGDPDPNTTVPLMHAMVDAGVDIIELGVPFSDPMADGPVIQAACERALKFNVSLRDVLNLVSEFRKDNTETPVVLMGYMNPIEVIGYKVFATLASQAGVDGVITVDMPPEESEDLLAEMAVHDIDPVFLLAPTTTEERMDKICSVGKGFVYYVSLKGVTGASSINIKDVEIKMQKIRKHTDLPVGVGFGIKDAQTAKMISEVSDAVVVGSAIIKIIEQNLGDIENTTQQIVSLLSGMRHAMDDGLAAKAS